MTRRRGETRESSAGIPPLYEGPEVLTALRATVFRTPPLADALDVWVRRHYRDRLVPADLGDPALLDESRRALDELTQLLRIGSVYPFQS